MKKRIVIIIVILILFISVFAKLGIEYISTIYTIQEFEEFINQKTNFHLVEKIIKNDARNGLEDIQWGNFILNK